MLNLGKLLGVIAAAVAVSIYIVLVILPPPSAMAKPASNLEWVHCYDTWHDKSIMYSSNRNSPNNFDRAMFDSGIGNCSDQGNNNDVLTVSGNDVCWVAGRGVLSTDPTGQTRTLQIECWPPHPEAREAAEKELTPGDSEAKTDCVLAGGEWSTDDNKCDMGHLLGGVENEFMCTRVGGLWLKLSVLNSTCISSPKYAEAEQTEPCKVDGIGQFFCPILNTAADFMDTAFAFLSDNFLVMKTQLVQGDETRQAWERFRDIANVMFVIGFLVIVYSQITNAGISNYGIKKMLPKIIVVAILVNLSYFICQLAIDISNYLGYALAQFFGQALLPRVEGSDVTGGLSGAVGTVSVIIAAVLALGATLYLMLSMGVLIPAILSLILVMIILIARQALIILLLVIAPIAFVAYLLPNTEHLLKSWWKMFYALLVIFPIIGLIFGVSKMVSFILMPDNMPNGPGDPVPPGFNFAMALMAVGAAALPFLAVPTVLKGSLKATGALGAKLEGGVNKLSGMAGGKASSNVKEKYDQSYMGKFMDARNKERDIRNARIAGGTYDYKGKNPVGKLNRLRSRASGKVNTLGMSGTAGDTMAAMGSAMEAKEREASVKAANNSFDLANPDDKELLALQKGEVVTTKSGVILSGKSAAVRMAAGARIVGNGDTGSINQLINQATSLSATDREGAVELNHLADALEKSRIKPKYIQAKDIAAMRHNGSSATMQNAAGMMSQGLKDNVYGPESMVTTGRSETSTVRRHIAERQKSADYTSDEKAGVDMYIDNARALTGDKRATFQVTDSLKSKLSKQGPDVYKTADGDFS